MAENCANYFACFTLTSPWSCFILSNRKTNRDKPSDIMSLLKPLNFEQQNCLRTPNCSSLTWSLHHFLPEKHPQHIRISHPGCHTILCRLFLLPPPLPVPAPAPTWCFKVHVGLHHSIKKLGDYEFGRSWQIALKRALTRHLWATWNIYPLLILHAKRLRHGQEPCLGSKHPKGGDCIMLQLGQTKILLRTKNMILVLKNSHLVHVSLLPTTSVSIAPLKESSCFPKTNTMRPQKN